MLTKQLATKEQTSPPVMEPTPITTSESDNDPQPTPTSKETVITSDVSETSGIDSDKSAASLPAQTITMSKPKAPAKLFKAAKAKAVKQISLHQLNKQSIKLGLDKVEFPSDIVIDERILDDDFPNVAEPATLQDTATTDKTGLLDLSDSSSDSSSSDSEDDELESAKTSKRETADTNSSFDAQANHKRNKSDEEEA